MHRNEELIDSVFCDVLEKLAFMFGESVEADEMPVGRESGLRATIEFSGDETGSISFALPEEDCAEIAANILGMSPDDQVAVDGGIDAMMEVLNIITGNVLTAMMGEDAVFDLSVPHINRMVAGQWDEMRTDPYTVNFLLDDVPVMLNIQTGAD